MCARPRAGGAGAESEPSRPPTRRGETDPSHALATPRQSWDIRPAAMTAAEVMTAAVPRTRRENGRGRPTSIRHCHTRTRIGAGPNSRRLKANSRGQEPRGSRAGRRFPSASIAAKSKEHRDVESHRRRRESPNAVHCQPPAGLSTVTFLLRQDVDARRQSQWSALAPCSVGLSRPSVGSRSLERAVLDARPGASRQLGAPLLNWRPGSRALRRGLSSGVRRVVGGLRRSGRLLRRNGRRPDDCAEHPPTPG